MLQPYYGPRVGRTDRAAPYSPERDWKALRESTGLSIIQASDLTGINKGDLSRIENRELRVTPQWAAELLRAYGKVT